MIVMMMVMLVMRLVRDLVEHLLHRSRLPSMVWSSCWPVSSFTGW